MWSLATSAPLSAELAEGYLNRFFPEREQALACRQRPHHREQEIYREWVANAGAELLVQRPKKHTGPVAISIDLGLPDKRRRDIDNCCNRCSIYWRGTPS